MRDVADVTKSDAVFRAVGRTAGTPGSSPDSSADRPPDRAARNRHRVHGLHVIEHEPHAEQGTCPIVVLVHGSLDRASSFSRVVRRLADLHVVTYDRRGYHRSRTPGPEGRADPFRQHVSDLLEVIGSRRTVIVGHSFGGDIALGAALQAPDLVAAVGAYEPPLPWMKWWPRSSERESAEADPGTWAEAFFRRVVSDEAWERLTEQARAQRRADGPALVAELASLRRNGAPFDLSVLSVPVVLGRGDRSVDHHRRAIDTLAQLLPRAEIFEIAGADHSAHVSHPDSFAELVRRVVGASDTSERSKEIGP